MAEVYVPSSGRAAGRSFPPSLRGATVTTTPPDPEPDPAVATPRPVRDESGRFLPREDEDES
jgi:hypothetical protein